MFDAIDANSFTLVIVMNLILFSTMTLVHEGASSYHKFVLPLAILLAACFVGRDRRS